MNQIDQELITELDKEYPKFTALTEKSNKNYRLFIDAGVRHIRLQVIDKNLGQVENIVTPSNRNLKEIFDEYHITSRFTDKEQIYIPASSHKL